MKSLRKSFPAQLAVLTILPCLLLAILLSPILYRNGTALVYRDLEDAASLQASYLASFLQEVAGTAKYTADQEEVARLLSGHVADGEALDAVEEHIRQKQSLLYYLDGIYIADENYAILNDLSCETDGLLLLEYQSRIFEPLASGAGQTFSIVPDSADVRHIYLAVPVTVDGRIRGYVVDKLNPVRFLELLGSDTGNEEMATLILDDFGTVLSGYAEGRFDDAAALKGSNLEARRAQIDFWETAAQKIEYTADNTGYIGFCRSVPPFGLAVVSGLPERAVGKATANILWLVVGIASFLCVAALALSQRLAGRVTGSLGRLISSLEEVQAGRYIEPLRIETGDEFQIIGESAGNMIRNYRQSARALHAAQDKCKHILDCSGELSFECDPEKGEFRLFIPQGYVEQRGRTLIVNESTTCESLLHPEDRAKVDEALRRSTELPYRLMTATVRGYLYEGDCTTLLARWMSIREEDDSIRIIGTFTDTDRVDALERKLADQEMKGRFAMEKTSDVFYEVDIRADTIQMNEELWYRILGLPLIGGYGAIFSAYKENVHREFRAEFDRLFSTFDYLLDKPGRMVTLDYQIKNKEGNYTWVAHTVYAAKEEGGHVTVALGHISDIADRKYRELEEIRQTISDPLTRAYNHRFMKIQITQSLISFPDSLHAFILLDIDGFGAINEQFGRLIADEALCRATGVLWQNQIGRGFVGRLEGDSFILFLPAIEERGIVQTICKQIRRELNRTINIEGQLVAMTASVGVSFSPDHGISYDELLACAKAALESARNAGGDQAVLFDNQDGVKRFIFCNRDTPPAKDQP